MAKVNFFGRNWNCFHLNVRWKSVDPTPTSKNSQYSISNLSYLRAFFPEVSRILSRNFITLSKVSSPSFKVLPSYFPNSMARKHWWDRIFRSLDFWANWCVNYDCLTVLQSFDHIVCCDQIRVAKVWTRMKILKPKTRSFVAILRFVVICALFERLWAKNDLFWFKNSVF